MTSFSSRREMTTLLARHGIAALRTGAEELERSMLEFAESRRP